MKKKIKKNLSGDSESKSSHLSRRELLKKTGQFILATASYEILSLLPVLGEGDVYAEESTALKWKYPIIGFPSLPPAIGNDGVIYVEGYEDMRFKLYAINPDGSLRWESETSYEKEFNDSHTQPVIGNNGIIYVAGENSLYAINPDGTQKWVYKIHKLHDVPPAIGRDGIIYAVGAMKFYALNPDGTLRWEYNAQTGWRHKPAIGSDGVIYFSGSDCLYAMNPDGILKWQYVLSYTDSLVSSPAIGLDGTIYVGSEKYLYAISPDKTLKWKLEILDSKKTSPVVGSDGTIYVGSGKYLYAVNPDGTLTGKFEIYEFIDSKLKGVKGYYKNTPPVIGNDGTIYVASGLKYLYAMSPDGILKWRYTTQYGMSTQPAIEVFSVRIYVRGEDYLYAINIALAEKYCKICTGCTGSCTTSCTKSCTKDCTGCTKSCTYSCTSCKYCTGCTYGCTYGCTMSYTGCRMGCIIN